MMEKESQQIRVFQKAIEKNIIQEQDVLSHRQVLELIFHPGFSTKEVQNKLSGRGVGLDVVHSTITDHKEVLKSIRRLITELALKL